eukprot:6185110-Pleurochrysis_carterae.AAC.3
MIGGAGGEKGTGDGGGIGGHDGRGKIGGEGGSGEEEASGGTRGCIGGEGCNRRGDRREDGGGAVNCGLDAGPEVSAIISETVASFTSARVFSASLEANATVTRISPRPVTAIPPPSSARAKLKARLLEARVGMRGTLGSVCCCPGRTSSPLGDHCARELRGLPFEEEIAVA